MIAGLIGSVLLREVPDRLLAGVTSGQYQVYGSIIRSVSSGRIVGHLQEAGGLSRLAGLVGSGPIDAVASVTQVVQNEQIKRGVHRLEAGMATLQHMGVAQLALGAAGVGVSVVGFAVLSRKIDGVKAEVGRIADRIDQLGFRIEHRAFLVDLDDLRGLARLLDEGRQSADLADRRWHKVAEDAPRLQTRFERLAGEALGSGPKALSAAEPALDALAMTSSLRIAALASLGHVVEAQRASDESAGSLSGLTGGIGAIDLLRTSEAVAPSGDMLAEARATVARLRAREASAATRAAPFAALKEQSIHPRDWLAAAHEETSAPMLFMPT